MKAPEIAQRAAELTGGDRKSDHGDAFTSAAAVACLWNGYILARVVSDKPAQLTAEDVANMMELFKISRRLNGRTNMDDYIDGAGYAALAGEIRSQTEAPPLAS